jgi:hypothetical protein
MAEQSDSPRAVHLHTDDFYGYIKKGHLDPWLREASSQNSAIANALTAVAGAYAAGGYEVFADGVVGPWLLEPWHKLARSAVAVHYVVLRPSEDLAVGRVVARSVTSGALRDGDVARTMWRHFSDLGACESHLLDTTDESLPATITRLKSLLTGDHFRLK